MSAHKRMWPFQVRYSPDNQAFHCPQKDVWGKADRPWMRSRSPPDVESCCESFSTVEISSTPRHSLGQRRTKVSPAFLLPKFLLSVFDKNWICRFRIFVSNGLFFKTSSIMREFGWRSFYLTTHTTLQSEKSLGESNFLCKLAWKYSTCCFRRINEPLKVQYNKKTYMHIHYVNLILN